jgi:hypothetical protein
MRMGLWLAPAVLVVVVAGGPPVRWGDHGHRISGRVAAERLPPGMPAFFRSAAGELEYLNPEPDRWRGDSLPEMRGAYRYDHFIDLELLPAGVLERADRFGYLAALQREGVPVDAGLLPYRIVELHQRLTTEFGRWRASKDAREREWIERRIIQDAGILGHYVADGANPHHTSVHHNGWADGYANPRGFTTDRTFHRRFESEFVAARVATADVLREAGAPAREIVDVRAETIAYLLRSHDQLERLYQLDRESAFGPGNRSEAHRRFATERLAAGALMLRDLWWSAWQNSGS